MSRPPLPEEDKLKDRFLLRCNDETYESWEKALDDMHYKHMSKFSIDMINKGIQSEKEMSYLRNHIKELENEIISLKKSQKIFDGTIQSDIFDSLFPEPSEQPKILSIDNLHEMNPIYSKERINIVLASDQDTYEYIKDEGWRIINDIDDFS